MALGFEIAREDLDEPYAPTALVEHKVFIGIWLGVVVVGDFRVERLLLIIQGTFHGQYTNEATKAGDEVGKSVVWFE